MLKFAALIFGIAGGLCAYTPAMDNQAHVPDQAEATAVLKAVCGTTAQVQTSPQGTKMFCSPCPDFTSMHGLTTQTFDLRFVLPGIFSAPAAQDLAAFFQGCEPLSANFGGGVLLNKDGDGWKMARYDAGLSPVSVRAIRVTAGRDVLFAESVSIGLGLVTNSLFTFDYMQQPVTSQHMVLQVSDTTRACGPNITKATLDKITWQGQNFAAAVTWGAMKAPDDYLKDCPDKLPAVPTKSYTLNFAFDGTAFQPAPDSTALYQQINQTQPGP